MDRVEILLNMEDQVPDEVKEEFIVHGTVPKGFRSVAIDKDGGQAIERDTQQHIHPLEKFERAVTTVKNILSGREDSDVR
ncbi:hypothetical protein HYZ78_01065 [Candidatus Microgenomates bacterium]|nr:hypothetical protein [Candidatus Microgenomates bacterium]